MKIMKKILILITTLLILLLTACNNNETIITPTINETKQEETQINSQENIINNEIEEILLKENELINKTEKTDKYTIFIYNNNDFEQYSMIVPEENKYELLAKEINQHLNIDINVSVHKNEENIYIDFQKNDLTTLGNDLNNEIQLLKSYAKTYSENIGCFVYFTIDGKDYSTNNFYFSQDEHYPIF